MPSLVLRPFSSNNSTVEQAVLEVASRHNRPATILVESESSVPRVERDDSKLKRNYTWNCRLTSVNNCRAAGWNWVKQITSVSVARGAETLRRKEKKEEQEAWKINRKGKSSGSRSSKIRCWIPSFVNRVNESLQRCRQRGFRRF